MEKFQEVVIIGGGPAGLSAAVNIASEGLSVTLVECCDKLGGQAKYSSRIENYLGFSQGITGQNLMSRAEHQALKFGTNFVMKQNAVRLTKYGHFSCIKLTNGDILISRVAILANGLQWRTLDVPRVDEFSGKSIFYGANMGDGPQYAGKNVTVVGGANSAGQAAMQFSKFAKTVRLIVRAESIDRGMSEYLVDRIKQTKNIEVFNNAEVSKLNGTDTLTSVDVAGVGSIETDGMFIFIGAEPRTKWLTGSCELDERGFILASNKHTSCDGVFAIGDVRKDSVKRIAASVGEGSEVAAHVHNYLGSL